MSKQNAHHQFSRTRRETLSWSFITTIALIAALSAATACGGEGALEPGPDDSDTEPTSLAVSITTVGNNFDPDGYALTVDGGSAITVATNDSRTLPAAVGSHSVTLSGLAANCTVTSGNPVTATVVQGSTKSVAFMVSCSGAPAPLTGKIAFESNRSGNFEVMVMNADGSGIVNLTNHPAIDYEPDWSPDGTRIAFVSRRDGNDEIYVMNADGTGQTRLTNDPGEDSGPEWSPDGTRIAFQTDREGDYEVYVMTATGGSPTNLSLSYAEDEHPAWSPDGTRIAFQSDRIDGAGYEVFVMNANGSNKVNLTLNTAYDVRPAWSPDGTRIAFVSSRDGNLEIYAMNANGTGQVRLTNDAELDSYPVWSPDGTRIAFRSDRAGNIEVFMINADGTGPVNRSNHPATDCHPSWHGTGGAAIAAVPLTVVRSAKEPIRRSAAQPTLTARQSTGGSCLGN